jgi:hypothetical protein
MPSRAVVIGPAKYAEDSQIDSHDEIGVSAQMYGRALAGDVLWRSNHRVLRPEEVDTADSVMRVLEQEAGLPGPDDVFLVIYVGHGTCWKDIPEAQVHFSVGSSYRDRPWTWLSSWYLYRAMRMSKAKLKVLIADCCYSNMLQHLGAESTLPGVLGQAHEGTCVFTAVKDTNYADAVGCPKLDGELARCTPFSGHLLQVLKDGTKNHSSTLTVGLIRDTVQAAMRKCDTSHEVSRMVLNEARESSPLFTNHMAMDRRDPPPRRPVEVDQWVTSLIGGTDSGIEELLADPRKTGEVVVRLFAEPGDRHRELALRLNNVAESKFSSPPDFAKYWNRVERVFLR